MIIVTLPQPCNDTTIKPEGFPITVSAINLAGLEEIVK